MDINIKTTLGINPRHKLRELLAITRGASFIFKYELPVSYNILEQLTFTFKQRKQIFWFKMFKYFVLTTDTELDETKTYYVKQPSGEYTVVKSPQEGSLNLYYEAIWEPEEGENNLDYIIADHFSYDSDKNIVTFSLSSTDTSKFYPSNTGAEVFFEIAARLNTEESEEFANQDSVIIYKQPKLIVNDSLYGQVSADSNTVSNSPERLTSTGRSVRE